MLADERPRSPCVVEVDVREEQMADVLQLEALFGEAGLERLDRRGRPAIEERRTVVRVHDVDADDALEALVHQVDGRERHAGSLSITAT